MRTARAALLVAALVAAVADQAAAARPGAAAAAASAVVGTGVAPAAAAYKAGEVLVQFKPNANKAAAFKQWGAREGKRVGKQASGKGDLVLAHLPAGKSVEDAVREFKGHGAVRFVEPNYKMTKLATPNDPLLSSLWGMTGTFGINGPTAWDTTTGSYDVYVGVVDEGIQYTHPDLAANMWQNADEVAGNGRDDDGNGYVDDIYGFDFYNWRGEVYSAADGDAHGTHVSGTIGGVGNNGVGVAGVNWNVKIISAKFLGPGGGYLSDAISALDYITDLKASKGLPIVATSNSWGCGTSCFSQSLLDAINRGYAQDILFIAAAGNEQTSSCSYPACFSRNSNGVIGVAALQSDGVKASYSNWGTWVHLGAPGSGIWSSVPTNSYASYSGTSMATPHVSGAAALYKSLYPTATADEVKDAILSSVTPTNSMANDVTSSGGRLNVAAMLGVVPASANVCPGGCSLTQYCSSSGCASCTGKCATCLSATTCKSCISGWTGTPSCSTPDCSAKPCNGTQFCAATASGGQCQACGGNCLSCTSSATNCVTCKAGWKNPPACTTPDCGTRCSTTQYCASSPTGGVCADCVSPCASCSSATTCTSCASGFTGSNCATRCGAAGARCQNKWDCCSQNCRGSTKTCV